MESGTNLTSDSLNKESFPPLPSQRATSNEIKPSSWNGVQYKAVVTGSVAAPHRVVAAPKPPPKTEPVSTSGSSNQRSTAPIASERGTSTVVTPTKPLSEHKMEQKEVVMKSVRVQQKVDSVESVPTVPVDKMGGISALSILQLVQMVPFQTKSGMIEFRPSTHLVE